MTSYIVLLRGINVGGKNKVPMAALRESLEQAGFTDVSTYIASGNVLLKSALPASGVQARIEDLLPRVFALDTDLIKVLVLSRGQLQAIVDNEPAGFGDLPDMYHSDAIFLMGISAQDTIKIFNPRDGVDKVWAGDGVVYSQRLSAERTRSRLSIIVGTPAYKSMTIRSWNTTTKLLALINSMD